MNGDENMTDVFGTDISNDWLFTDGDLELVSGEANLAQAVYNRLMTDWDFYTQFYTNYGGRLYEHFGDFNNPNIHEYIRIEVESILQQDPRIKNIECSVNKTSSKEVEVELTLTSIGSDEVVAMNLILRSDSSILISPNTSELTTERR